MDAQFIMNTNQFIGQSLKTSNKNDPDTFMVHFNTTTPCSRWFPAHATANLGNDSVIWEKCQTQMGIQASGYLDAVRTDEYRIGTTYCNNFASHGKPLHVYNLDSLQAVMNHSIKSGTINGNNKDSLSRPAPCLFDLAPGNSAFGLYPGRVKRVEYKFSFDFIGKDILEDISFDIDTYYDGNLGKSATYEIQVAVENMTNIVYTNTDFYTTSSGKSTVYLANLIGQLPSYFSNKKVYIYITTIGTSTGFKCS